MKVIVVKTAKDMEAASDALDQCRLRMLAKAEAPSKNHPPKSREAEAPHEPVIIIVD